MTTIQNPILEADFPDPSILHHEDIFYMATTSMHFMPGIPILRSWDLAHWELASYVYDTFEDNDGHNLKNEANIYGQGSWATSLRFHKGWFYLCFNSNDTQSTYIYRARNMQNDLWERTVLSGMHHDPSLWFDDDGRTWLIYGNGTIFIRELAPDAMSLLDDSPPAILVDTPRVDGLNCEGSQLCKVGNYYYLMLIQWPKSGACRRIQWCYRSESLRGIYTGRVVLDDDLGYHNKGVAQGGLFEFNGHWYAMLFQDRDSLGRSPILVPVKWQENWPVLGENGRVPSTLEVPLSPRAAPPICGQDSFDYSENKLPYIWQWNHNPDAASWSVTQRPGWLRLTNSGCSSGLLDARNTLTQRHMGQSGSWKTRLDIAGMRPGDCAGLAALQHKYAFVGVRMQDTQPFIVMCCGEGRQETLCAQLPLQQGELYLKLYFDFTDGIDLATFMYSLDEKLWQPIGQTLQMEYRLEHFVGYRPALFNYTQGIPGGWADFDYLSPEE